jgi:hypothetical protein
MAGRLAYATYSSRASIFPFGRSRNWNNRPRNFFRNRRENSQPIENIGRKTETISITFTPYQIVWKTECLTVVCVVADDV